MKLKDIIGWYLIIGGLLFFAEMAPSMPLLAFTLPFNFIMFPETMLSIFLLTTTINYFQPFGIYFVSWNAILGGAIPLLLGWWLARGGKKR